MTKINTQIDKALFKKFFVKREGAARKYDFGLLLVIGGSDFYSGSPALSALSAFRSGADMVRIIAPKRAADIIASFLPDIAAYPLQGTHLKEEHLSLLLSMTESVRLASRGKEAIVIGGGMGRTEATQSTIREYLSQVSIPAVIDADGIHAISSAPEKLVDRQFLLTPHGNEFFVLTKINIDGMTLEEKIKVVEEQALKLKTTILLKGGVDIISNGKETALNETGSPYMTKGGMGDTLAGIAGAMLARGATPFEAGQLAAFINGLAGEIAIKKYGESVMATDLINAIPEALKKSGAF